MSNRYNIILSTANAQTTNTVGKDYTWIYDFSRFEEGSYEVSFIFTSGNIALASYATNNPIVLNMDIGVLSENFIALANNTNSKSQIVGTVPLIWNSATVGTYKANTTDNNPVLFNSINRNTNFIRLSLIQIGSGLITTGLTPWNVILSFKKV